MRKYKSILHLLLMFLLISGLSLTLLGCNNDNPDLDPDDIENKEPEPRPLIDLDEYDAYYIVTSPGTDASSTININYHTKNAKTNVEYTTSDDDDFEHAEKITGKCYVFELDYEELAAPFEARNVCQVEINDLSPNSSYQYRVNKGDDTYTNTYHFTTSGANDTTSFLFMTDIHYYAASDGAKISEEVIKSALSLQPKLDFLFTTGDILDRGGNPGDWDMKFTHAKSLEVLPYAGVPGNHEYYDTKALDNSIFASYYHYPKNSVSGALGVSYYFIHNDTLFFQIDTNNKIYYTAQLEWMEKTIQENPTKFIIVGTHPPKHLKGVDYDPTFMALMDKYSVDLVLAGHYHSDNFTELYNGVKPTNPFLGVTYMNGIGGGAKALPAGADPQSFAKGYIIDIVGDQILIRYIDGYGKIIANRTINSKKTSPKEEATKEELIDSIILTHQEANKELLFSWSSKFYRNVIKMEIASKYRDMKKETIVFPTPAYTNYLIKNINPDFEYSYLLTLTFNDLTTTTKELSFKIPKNMNIQATNLLNNSVTLSWDAPASNYSLIVQEYQFFLDGKLVKTQKSFDDNFNQITTTLLTNLVSKRSYTLEIKVIGRDGYMYSNQFNFTTK